MAGRPSDYSPEIAATICARMAEGDSVRTICAADDMPALSTVFRWLSLHADFSDQYAKAAEERTRFLAEDMLDIADDGTNDWMEVNGKDSVGWRENGEAISRSRLRVDTRKWLLSKLVPKKYGDRASVEHSGPDGGPIRVAATDLTDDDLARIAAGSGR